MNFNNNSEVLHLTEPMVLDLIKKVEQSITEIATKMESKIPDLKEAEELYLPLKQEYDNFQAQLDKEKVLLQTLVGFKNNNNIRKNVRVLKSISNSKPTKHTRPRLPISDEAQKVLHRTGSFLRFKNLVIKMFESNPQWDRNWMNSIELNLRSVLSKGGSSKKLRRHNDKVGLPDWFDEHGVPEAKFLNSLIHT